MKISKRKIVIYSLFIILGIMTIYGVFATRSFGDEAHYHYPLARNFTSNMLFNENSSYSSAYTPLPYIIGHGIYMIIPSLYVLRLLNWLVVLLTIFAFYMIMMNIVKEKSLELTLLFAANPYLITSSFYYLAYPYGILFALLGIYFYFYSTRKYHYFIAHIMWGLAVLCMQWLLMIYVGIMLFEIRERIKSNSRLTNIILFRSVITKAVSLIPILTIFYIWRGITHPNFQTHTMVSSLEHVCSVLAILGFVFFFYLIFSYKFFMNERIFYLLFLFPLLFLAQPQHSANHGITSITGIVSALMKKIEVVTSIPYPIGSCVLTIVGVMVLWLFIRGTRHKYEFVVLYIVLGLSTALAVSTRLGASHIFVTLLPFAIILTSRHLIERKYVVGLMIVQMYLITIVYLLYIINYRSEGVYFIK